MPRLLPIALDPARAVPSSAARAGARGGRAAAGRPPPAAHPPRARRRSSPTRCASSSRATSPARRPRTSTCSPSASRTPRCARTSARPTRPLGRYDDAIDQYRRALARDAWNVAIRRNLALAFYKTGRMEDAAREAEAVAARAARQRRRAPAPRRLPVPPRPERPRSSTCCSRSLAARSQDRAVSYLLGMALIERGADGGGAGRDRPRAARRRARGTRVPRDDVPARRRLREGEPEIRKALDANPKLPLVNFLTASADGREAPTGPGDRGVPRELAVDPNHFEANLYLGDLLREGARHDEACRTSSARGGCGPTPRAQFSLGAVYVALGRTERRCRCSRRWRRWRRPPQTHMQLAVVYTASARSDAQREKAAVVNSRARETASSGRERRARRLLARPTRSPRGPRRPVPGPRFSHRSSQPSARKPCRCARR